MKNIAEIFFAKTTIIVCALFALFSCQFPIHADTAQKTDSKRFFVSQTATEFVEVFFSNKNPTNLYDFATCTPKVDAKVFYRTIFDYRNVFTDYRPGRYNANIQLVKTIDLGPDTANCYFLVTLKTRGLFSRTKKLLAIRLDCKKQDTVWFVRINPEVNPQLPDLFTTLYTKTIPDRTALAKAKLMASKIIDSDTEKQLGQREQVTELLSEGRVLYRLGQFSQALEAFEQVLSVEKNPEAKMCAEQCQQALDKEQEKVYQASVALERKDKQIRALEAEKSRHEQEKQQVEQNLTREIEDLKKEIARIKTEKGQTTQETQSLGVVQQINASAQQLFNAGKYRKAAVQARKALSIEPQNQTARTLLELSKKAISIEQQAV